MMLKILRVIETSTGSEFFATDEQGKDHRLDIYVDGGITEDRWPPEYLIGRWIQCEYLAPMVECPFECKLIGIPRERAQERKMATMRKDKG